MRPFLILALPRSRTAWISKYLTYGDVHCGHEQLRYARSLGDIQSWLSIPMTGTCETAAMHHWRLARAICPSLRLVTVHRDPSEIARSLCALDTRGSAYFEPRETERVAKRLAQKLWQVAERTDATPIDYEALNSLDGLRLLWEAVMPYPFDEDWAIRLSSLNIQLSVPHLMKYFVANMPQLTALAMVAKSTTIAQMKARRASAQIIPFTRTRGA
jgi:hypothetical protein